MQRPQFPSLLSTSMTPVVDVRNLTKRYTAEVLAVDDLVFTVDAGDVTGMLGPNGAGRRPRCACSSA